MIAKGVFSAALLAEIYVLSVYLLTPHHMTISVKSLWHVYTVISREYQTELNVIGLMVCPVYSRGALVRNISATLILRFNLTDYIVHVDDIDEFNWKKLVKT